MDSGASEKCVETRQTKGQRSEARVEGPRQGEMRGSPLTRDTGDQGTVRRHQRTLSILPAYWAPRHRMDRAGWVSVLHRNQG